jgi:serine/threonine protein kinase
MFMLHQPGEILGGKYRIERFLGAGAFGEVYLATHLKLEARRALKLLSRSQSGLASTEIAEFRDRFTLEAQLGARLKHDRLVQIFDFEEIGDELLLVMEYAAGGSLADRMKALKQSEQIISVSEVERIGLETAEGLAVIHALDVVHRDLKPGNLLLDAQEHVKIADLGLAQVSGGSSSRSQLGSLARPHPGTPAYMSPEQETSPGYLRPASDVYALGIILFELLTGRNYKNLEPGTRVKSLRTEVPDWFDELLAKMLADEPRRRPWNGEKVAGLLRSGLAQETAPPGSRKPHPAGSCRKSSP